jgi:XTP/dITP diphosphohydrolase
VITAAHRRPRQVVCASANPSKVAEIAEIIGGAIELLPRPDGVPDVVEDAGSLVGNARLKASAIAASSALPGLADDTGLEVAALGGLPGVDTATYAGPGSSDEENWAKLLAALEGETDRRARFRTVAMIVWPDGHELFAEGTCAGEIVARARGSEGFGYDSVFMPAAGDGRTFAEMTRLEKQAISHRGEAFAELFRRLLGPGFAEHR